MRVRGATAIVVLIAGLLAGCGGGSASTGAAQRAAGLEEEGGIIGEGEPGPRHVEEGEMVAGEEGWVRTRAGVFWTPDGGRTWRPITPPVPDLGLIDGIWFANSRHGWALWDTGREGDSRPSMYRTGDGGRSWHRTRLRAYDQFAPVAEVSFSLVDGRELFALTRVDGDPARFFGPLFVSRDAGRHWRALPPPPVAGEISFETPRRGWIAGGHGGQSLYRTVDGGRTWQEVVPGKPLGSPPPTELEWIHNTRWTSYTAPLLGPDGHGILGMVEASEKEGSTEATRAVIWRTNDFGRSWRRGERIEFPNTTATYEARQVFIRRGRGRSFIVRDPLGGAWTVVGPDGRAGPLRPTHGLPRDSEGFTFSDARHGFAFPFFGNRSSLSFTEDGGRDWTQVPGPRASP